MNVLVAQTPGAFRNSLVDVLRERHRVRTCDNSVELLMELGGEKPELLILDLMLPGTSGLLILQTLRDADRLPPTVALGCFISRYISDQLNRMGILEVFRLPCSVYAIAGRVMSMEQELSAQIQIRDDLYRQAERILFSLGFRRDLIGYNIILEAILSLCADSDQALTKELYPKIASLHGGTAAQTEKAIRTCIKAALRRDRKQVWLLYFGADGNGELQKITNAVFLFSIAGRLRDRNLVS